MFRLALKNVLARKGRLLLTSLAVIAGTPSSAGVFVFSDTITTAFDDLFADAFDNTDAYVRSANVHRGRLRRRRARPDPRLADRQVAGRPGCEVAESAACSGFAQ